jgi:hypothetical protein
MVVSLVYEEKKGIWFSTTNNSVGAQSVCYNALDQRFVVVGRLVAVLKFLEFFHVIKGLTCWETALLSIQVILE